MTMDAGPNVCGRSWKNVDGGVRFEYRNKLCSTNVKAVGRNPAGDRSYRKLPGRTLNQELSESVGREVVKIEALPVSDGQPIRLLIESCSSTWRQGVRFVTAGLLSVNGVKAPQLDLWIDTAPPSVEILCEQTDGLVRFYNIWQSGRRPGVESRSATSGMVVEVLDDGWRRYSCNDIGFDPEFTKLVFRVRI
jgi:hypothetical protein